MGKIGQFVHGAWRKWVLLALAASPALMPILLIHWYGINFIYWDEWTNNFAGLVVKYHQHALSWADFTAQHNEHRALVPKVLYFLGFLAFHGNSKFIMYAQWLIVCATSAGVLVLQRQTHPTESRDGGMLFKWFICNIFLFSIAQWENWLWAVGMMNFLPMALIVWGLVAACSRLGLWPRVGLSMACAFAASFSQGAATASWLLIGLALFWSDSRRELAAKKWALCAWVAGLMVCTVMYVVGYQKVTTIEVKITPTIMQRLGYFAMAVENLGTFEKPLGIALVLGAAMAVLYLLVVAWFVVRLARRQSVELSRRMLPWLLAGSFAILCALMTTVLRAQLGVAQSTASRYVTFSIWLPISMVMLIPAICSDLSAHYSHGPNEQAPGAAQRLLALAPGFLLGIAVSTQIFCVPRVIQSFKMAMCDRAWGKAIMLMMKITPASEALTHLVHNDEKQLFAVADALNQLGYLQPPLITSAVISESNVSADKVEGDTNQYNVVPVDQLHMGGWAYFPDKQRPADWIAFSYDDTQGRPILFTVAMIRVGRDDVGNYMDSDDYRLSGWDAVFPITIFPPEPRILKIRVWAIDTDNGKFRGLQRTFDIKR